MIQTKTWHIQAAEGGKPSPELAEAASIIREGGVVAFPTETVYGLGADATNTEAVQNIFTAKGRPSDNPLIVHVAGIGQLNSFVLPCSALAKRLMDAFWPGPLTIVLPVREGALSPLVTAGLSTVGVRMPDHETALSLIQLADRPIAAPSANRSGRPSPTLAAHVAEDLSGRIDGIVDGGVTGVGLESTVIELAGDAEIRILRPGGITLEELRQTVPGARIDTAAAAAMEHEAPRSPGMKYTHYAPQGQLSLVQGDAAAVVAYINEQAAAAKARGETTGVLAFEERAEAYRADLVISCGSEHELHQGAHLLYDALRRFDAAGTQRIWGEACSEQGIGAALMNRMVKAAGHTIVHV